LPLLLLYEVDVLVYSVADDETQRQKNPIRVSKSD